MTNLTLRPIHYASVSGGKDSLYMLYYILEHKEKYPLDLVVNFELETDYPFIKEAVKLIEEICKKINVPFMRIKPRKSFKELYDKYGYPSRKVRWCNSCYKLDCQKQLNEWIKKQNCRPIAYIGLCANETKRFKYKLGNWENHDICYPLAEENIQESYILQWAKNVPVYNNWYNYFIRCGCMGCPMASRKQWTYLYLNYPDIYKNYMNMIKESEIKYKYKYFYYDFEKEKYLIEHTSLKITLF